MNQTCVSGQEKIRRGERRLCGNVLHARRSQTRTSRCRRGTMSTPVLTRHRSWKIRVPPSAADLDSRVETQGCSAPSSGRSRRFWSPFDSRLVNTHPRTHTQRPSCPWLQLPSPANHVTVQAAVPMLLAEEAGLQCRRTASVSGQRRRSGFKLGGWLRRDYVVGV